MIRQLRHGEPIPDGAPRRYGSSRGYVRLRWKVGPKQYVEAYEHRFVGGMAAPEVHHKNRIKDDNHKDNLEPLTVKEHRRRHARIDLDVAEAMYRSGVTLTAIAETLGTDHANLSRRLRQVGVQMREAGRPCIDVDYGIVKSLLCAGMGRRQIAASLGVGGGPIVRALREMSFSRSCGRVRGHSSKHGIEVKQ